MGNNINLLNYIIKYSEKSFSFPEEISDEDERALMQDILDNGTKAEEELKEMTALCSEKYELNACFTMPWIDGSKTKTRRYLCSQMKYDRYADIPVSISIFIEKCGVNQSRFRVSLDLINEGIDKSVVSKFHEYLNISIENESGLVLASGSDEWGNPQRLNTSQEEAKLKVRKGEIRKVQLCKYIERIDNETDEYYKNEILDTVGQLIPYYEKAIGYDDSKWWPSLEEYNPGITTAEWVKILHNPKLTTEKNLRMLAMMMDYGRPASCSELAEKYGETKNFFNSGTSAYAKNVAKFTGCPVPPKRINENARWWPILYVGRNAKKEEKGSYIWKLRDELKSALEQIELPEIKESKCMDNNREFGLNTILYGPPGTGKTYNTVKMAVSICDSEFAEPHSDYSDYIERYNELKEEGRITFTTFHQSYGYEEFIEGIKPCLDGEGGNSENISYKVEDGLFKKFCNNARRVTIQAEGTEVIKTDPKVWCILLDGTRKNSEIKRYCFEHNEIRIGWEHLPEIITEETDVDTSFTRSMLLYFQDSMEIGDIVIVQKGHDNIDAIGIVTGDYEFDKTPLSGKMPRKRNVKWLAKDFEENILELNGGKHLGRPTIYSIDRINVDDILNIAKKYSIADDVVVEKENKPYVFIIDEINRGNISKIFGELITLIETTKRLGEDEAATATLPYSNQEFGVPNNVYILGTMNTADRSIALMDTALRRRFEFIEMMPDSNVIDGITISSEGETLDVAEMLRTINQRIEYLFDREHTIGHAFFTGLRGEDATMKNLAKVFKNKVVPLLQEYFYEDYEKIQLVLGDNDKSSDIYKFILDKRVNENEIFKRSPQLDLHEKNYEIQNEAFDKIRSYIEITETRTAED